MKGNRYIFVSKQVALVVFSFFYFLTATLPIFAFTNLKCFHTSKKSCASTIQVKQEENLLLAEAIPFNAPGLGVLTENESVLIPLVFFLLLLLFFFNANALPFPATITGSRKLNLFRSLPNGP